jgi:TonB family protein
MQRVSPRIPAAVVAILLASASNWSLARLATALSPPPPAGIPPPPAPPPMDVTPRLDLSSRVQPVFPGFDAIYALGGRVILDVTVSNSGSVGDVRVEASTGHLELDKSAIDAVRQWHFLPGDVGGKPSGGVVRVPITFNPEPFGFVPHNRLWPSAYARPRYVADPTPIAYSSVDAAFDQVPADAHRSLRDAHAIEQLLVHDAHGRLVQWWIFTDLHTPDAMATRMVFGGTPGHPVIEVASLCNHAAVCAERKAETLRGPSFARSP